LGWGKKFTTPARIAIAVNKDLEEVCSNVVELMNYGDWKKEYKQAGSPEFMV
jgi:hypothetical protein